MSRHLICAILLTLTTAAATGCGDNLPPVDECITDPESCEVPEAFCGDGVIAAGEDCDDDNRSDFDGCDVSCEVEHGYTCDGEPSSCTTTCGDGLVAGDEECDD